MGKSDDQIKTKTKQIQKSPISTFWMGTSPCNPGRLTLPQSCMLGRR